MKRFAFYALYAAIAATLCLVSCTHDINPNGGNDDTPSEEDIFRRVVGQLADYNQIPQDYQGKTFTPAIGNPDNGDESIRIVALNGLQAAVTHFNDLTDSEITETTATHTWQHKDVGSLTWQLSGDNTCWATVDVNIPSVPGLHKIIYRSAEQGDVNGSVGDGGSAYYRFGDVIQRRRAEDNEIEYWICVRPSFDPEGKGDSHWVSVSPLPQSKIWPYNSSDPEKKGKPHVASNRMEYGFPDNIGDEIKWHQDLAELLFAIIYPDEWATNITNNSGEGTFGPTGLPIFYDFHSKYIKYHNADFWKNVQKQWKDRNLVPFLFGVTYDEMAAAINPNNANARGLHFLYEGFGWNTSISNKPKLYQLHYTNGTGSKEKNLHKQTKKTVSAQVVVPRTYDESNTNFPMDVYKLTSARPYLSETRFFGDAAPRWIVRFADGEQLAANGRYDPQQPISGFSKASEIYRYYEHVFPEKNLTDAPEVTQKGGGYGYTGRAHYRFGDVYKDEQGAKWFVISQSGYDANDQNIKDDKSPYSELISFDPTGFTENDIKTAVTNLPTLDQALRAYQYLYYLTSSSIDNRTEADLDMDMVPGKTTLNILRNAGVDMRNIMQAIIAQSRDPRDASLACCIAYKDPEAGYDQALVRCIVNFQNANKDPRMYFWTKYPSAPDLQTQFVQNFSDTKILLGDISNLDKVLAYSKDVYAVTPLDTRTKPDSDPNVKRSIRTSPDNRSKGVSNYYYDLNAFNNVTYPGSMWYEPVLVFRYTRVRDHGDNDYDKQSVDGRTLTLVAARDWNFMGGDKNSAYDAVSFYQTTLWQNRDLLYLNGQPYHLKLWSEIENNEIKSR